MASLIIAGILCLIAFYFVIFVTGIAASMYIKVSGYGSKMDSNAEFSKFEQAAVAGRQIHGIVGCMTMIATTVGGGFLNGTAESIATSGLVWTISPFAICVGLIIGGFVFAGPMRQARYVTMLQPVQQKYGRLVVFLVYLASLSGDVFWTASILSALGTSMSIIIGLPVHVSIVISAGVTLLYTTIGQMVSVAYTDVLQLLFISFGLALCLPFIHTNEHAGDVFSQSDQWLGHLTAKDASQWIDLAFAMTLGTIPWQSYFQRVLSVRSVGEARCLSFVAGVGVLLFAVPSILIGAQSTVADWTGSNYTSGLDPVTSNQSSMVLPLTLYQFTPRSVSVVGIGAISAAVMSSMDSSVLGSSSMFTQNIYVIVRPEASDNELMWVQRLAICVIGAGATVLSMYVQTVWGLFILAADIVFVIVLPQLTAALFIPSSNSYGAFTAFFVGAILRFLAGENTLHLPAIMKYPYYDYENGLQVFPFRTFAFLASVISLVIVSWLTGKLCKQHLHCDRRSAVFNVCNNSEKNGFDLSTCLNDTHSTNAVSMISYRREPA